jgi:hypothetical protein
MADEAESYEETVRTLVEPLDEASAEALELLDAARRERPGSSP